MKLSAKKRRHLAASQFALKSERKYPVNDKAHARNAKARASQQYNKGNLSLAKKNLIDRAADKVLHKRKK